MPNGGLVGIHTEITEQKRIIGELAVARDAAAAAVAAKSRLLSHVSHEMRTPLVSLLRLTEQFGSEPQLTATQRHRIRLVEAAGRHMLALANEVLDLAALEAGRLNLHVSVVEASPIFEEAAAMLQPVAEARCVRIETWIDGLPPAIHADPTRLRQVVLNLLSNAVKFTPEGTVVRLAVRGHAGRLVFDVTDEGTGIPLAVRDQLFVDFGKLSPAAIEGTGLGLAITGRLVELMGGSVTCMDQEGSRGACFRVDLPLEPAELPQAAEPAATLPITRLRILGVDDSPANLAVLRALLSTTGFEMEMLTSGPAALEALQAAAREGRPFDVVLMDVMMPGMDGLETTRRIRALPGIMGRVPVIAVTASAFPEDIEAAREAGMALHVSKPVERALLLKALAAAVTQSIPGTQPDLVALRPALIEELHARMKDMRCAAPGSGEQVHAVHALVGTVGNLGEMRLVQLARSALVALRKQPTEAQSLVKQFDEALRAGFPEAR
jgi:CheY-like chemotaxis protein/nitrogen-specific signal transduction histidine kinase